MNDTVKLNGGERRAIFGVLGGSQSREFIVQSEVSTSTSLKGHCLDKGMCGLDWPQFF